MKTVRNFSQMALTESASADLEALLAKHHADYGLCPQHGTRNESEFVCTLCNEDEASQRGWVAKAHAGLLPAKVLA